MVSFKPAHVLPVVLAGTGNAIMSATKRLARDVSQNEAFNVGICTKGNRNPNRCSNKGQMHGSNLECEIQTEESVEILSS